MKRAAFLKKWRESDLGLSLTFVAHQAGMSGAELREIEEDQREPYTDELEALARVLGLHLDQVLPATIRTVGPEPIRVLLKSSEAFRPSEESRAAMTDAARAALDLMALNTPNTTRLTALPAQGRKAVLPDFKLGDQRARHVRRELAIEGPVASMHELVAYRLHVPVLGAELGQYGPDAFTVYSGLKAAIILNISAGTRNSNVLARRFTLAHELGHVLFDRPAPQGGMACRVSNERTLQVETQANAFAMRLLLPESEVHRLGNTVLEGSVFRDVMLRWGVHYAALSLYCRKMLGLDDVDARRMPNVDTSAPLHWREAEELPCEQTPALSAAVPVHRRQPLMTAAFDASVRGDIGTGELRALLGVDSSVLPGQVAAVLGRDLDA